MSHNSPPITPLVPVLDDVTKVLGEALTALSEKKGWVTGYNEKIASARRWLESHPVATDDESHVCEECKANYIGKRCPLCVVGVAVTEDEWNDQESLERAITLACANAGYHFGFGEGVDIAASAAQKWFADRKPVTTDKAVCPTCGETVNMGGMPVGPYEIVCLVCRERFWVEMKSRETFCVSPPSKPKATP